MEFPKTAAELNLWLQARFLMFDGPPKAFFELPVTFDIMGTMGLYGHVMVRRAYITLALIGPEAACVEAMAGMFCGIPDGEALFMRRAFAYEDYMLSGRCVFWRENLPGLRFVKAEAAPAEHVR